MDEYDKKFAEMQKYIPFLEAMIERLQNVKDKSREVQLQKMQSLHGILSNSKRKLKIETLQRCEDVLQKLHNRVEKGNTPGLQLSTKQSDDTSLQFLTSPENAQSEKSKKTEGLPQSKDAEKDRFEETPASPDPSVSPDSCQILPIIIPTERSTDFSRTKQTNSNIPVITLTENTKIIPTISLDSSSDDATEFTEWDMLEESERHSTKTRGNCWQSMTAASGHDVATAAKLVSNNLPQKINDGRSYSLGSRNIPTVSVPSLGGSRRLSSMLEKNKLNLDIITSSSTSRPESPVNVPEVRLKSPDPEILFPRSKVTSPRSKDNHNVPKTPTKKTPTPLLVSPPPISSEPPLSMEDLAELLSEEDGAEKADESGAKQKKDSGTSESLTKDGKTPKSFSKSNEKGPLHQGSSDHRLQQTSSISSKFPSIQEPRYADNYERHPRQRDSHSLESGKDKPVASNSSASTVPEEEVSQIQILCSTVNSQIDERNVPIYQRRPSVPPPEALMNIPPSRSDKEFMTDGIDYYNMHMNQMHWPMQPPAATSDHQFGNAQWTPNIYSGMTNQPPLQPTQHPYPRPMNMFVGTNSMDPHPVESHRQNQFPSTGPRSLLNPVARSQDMNHVTRPENMREDIPPLRSAANFAPPQYRGFQMGQGSYDPAFDRSTEYPHMRPTWEGPPNRVGEAFSGENVVPCGIGVVEGTQYPRAGTPWPRDRCNRGRGRDGYFNERNRTEVRPGFNRDVRRPDWPRDNHVDRENPNRFNRDNRSVSERDPRVRTENNATILNQAKEHSNTNSGSARDPRLAKDKHLTPKAKDAAHNERDPRKRPVPPIIPVNKKINNKEKPKSPEKRVDSESSSCKEKTDKSKIDRMQSPLESLYGVIDTKSSHGCGLQKFKIPKIKRSEPPSLPSSTTNHTADETKEAKSATFKQPRSKKDGKRNSSSNSQLRNSNKDGAVAEVSSSSNINDVTEDALTSVDSRQDEVTKEGEVLSTSPVKETNKNEGKTGKIDSVIGSKANDVVEKSRKDESEVDGAKSKEEETKELIEALIRKSFESGEGKKLVEHAKLIRKLEKVFKKKKLKKIKKIIESDSESSSSDKDVDLRKTQIRKRRVIMSDSSDDECLAERLGILHTSSDTNDEKTEQSTTSTNIADPTKYSSKKKLEATASSNLGKKLARSIKCYAKKSGDGLLKELSEKNNIQIYNSDKGSVTELEKSDETNNVSSESCNGDNNKKNYATLGNSHKKEKKRLESSKIKKSDTRSESDKQLDGQLLADTENKKELVEEKQAEKEKQDNIDRISSEESKTADSIEQLSNQNKNQTDLTESVAENIVDNRANESSNDKPKTRTKRRNSLEMLQEDIREMFISDDVVSATGYRMCRMPKESQVAASAGNVSAVTSSMTSTPTNSKKDDASFNVPEKKSNAPVAESSSEAMSELSNVKSKKALKSRNSGEPNKSKAKGKKDNQRLTRSQHSKESVLNSGSEEDQPLALRTEWMLNISNNTPNQEEDCDEESNDAPRRSKRVLRKDIAKEARVLVEKTDIAKLDLSKVMFDSSSDESFSIDVSVLAAAVESSLRPDKQSDQESADTVASSKTRRKTVRKTNKGNSKAKKNLSFLTDNKSDDGMSFTDEESMTSDISRSSSTTVWKKRNSGAARTRPREELLSNILVGLVPTTTTTTTTMREKITDKGNEADVDEETNDRSLIEVNAKKSTKKKKKKSSWQMGIVQKKKRKKNTSVGASSSSSSKTGQTERERANTETNLSTNNEERDPLSLDDNNIVTTEEASENIINDQLLDNINAILANIDSIVKCEEIDSKQSIKMDPVDSTEMNDTKLTINHSELLETSNTAEGVSLYESFLSIEENKPILKTEVQEEKIIEDVVIAPTTDTTEKIPEESIPPKIIYDERLEEVFSRMDTEQLIKYAWAGQDKYKCLLCLFVGKNIVHHYKINHPKREVLISRLKSVDATSAIHDAESGVAAEIPASQICKYHCRFCSFIAEGAADVALEAFYEHCTTHTGEYRFHCNNCPYQAVAKASMKTHYYKMCRKLNDTFNEATSEDEIPKENSVYGYICCDCNYVQLKRQNVELHVAFWHRNETSIKILKINMSATITEKDKSLQKSTDTQQPFAEKIKPEVLDMEDIECKEVFTEIETEPILQAASVTDTLNCQVNSVDEERSTLHESNVEKDADVIVKQEADEKSKATQEEPEGLANTTGTNLSVFVCPPELENKEVEIQLERKKRMQEIANNIGINLNKNLSKPGLSIIDKLQDKMRTTDTVTECNESTNISEEKENCSSSLTNLTVKSSQSDSSVNINEGPPNQSTESENVQKDSSSTKQLIADSTEVPSKEEEEDKTEVNIRDPLAIMDPSKNLESDDESDEVARHSPVFDSESSSEQSDSEQTDVNMILKETSSINASSSRDPMLTTIQRLAAQLQGAKPLDVPVTNDDIKIKSEPISLIPRPPNVVPISTLRYLLTKQEANQREITSPRKDASPPKKFIRFRRLSGDMLSIPAPLLDNQEDTRASSTDGTQSDSAIDILQTDTEEECSFLKIENVVSLAPKPDVTTKNAIVNDIRMAVEISPIKNKGVSLLKKRSCQSLILKKMNVLKQSLTNTQPTTSESMTLFRSLPTPILPKPPTVHLAQTANFVPIIPKPPKIISLEANKVTFPLNRSSIINTGTTKTVTTVPGSSSTANVNYKILKVVRTPALVKPNDPLIPSVTIKQKTADAYSSMLKEENLIHFYKCMGHDCRFTSDFLILYYQHYHQHCQEISKQKAVPPYDFQKCAYCYMILSDWTSMKNHMWEKHGHCRYQCGYCFYRAVVPSYVRQHQVSCHPNSKFYMLVGKMGKPIPQQEDINRNDYILPFICNHDCEKLFYVPETFSIHLTKKHLSSKSTFKCHMCNVTFVTTELLLSHYKSHGFSKYQCLYCLYGLDNPTELHQHLSAFHCNRLPKILERSLPLVPSLSKDVVEQLILRTFDEFGKLNEEIHESDTNATSSKSDAKDARNIKVSTNTVNILTYPEQSSVEIALNQERIPNLLGSMSSDKDSIEATVTDIMPKQLQDVSQTSITENTSDSINEPMTSSQKQNLHEGLSLNKPNEDKSFSQSEKKKLNDYSTKHILHEPELELLPCMNDSNAVDPLEFDCSDEFVNTNLLDNSDFLKNLTANFSNVLFSKDDMVISDDKTEDSDVEILESTECAKIAEKKENDVHETANPESSEQSSTDKEEQSEVACEDKYTSKETLANSIETAQPDEPLTLKDIKHTGYSGVELYKCGSEECGFAATNSSLLRAHIKECSRRTNNKNLSCVHCKKRFIRPGFLLEHLKAHGLKRFGCSLCKMRYAVSYQATAHMKTKHKHPYTKLVPADPTNPSVDGLFIVQAIHCGSAERKTKKRKGSKLTEQESEKIADNEKLQFSPDEIDRLPRQAIYVREVQCAMCPYTTKVRTNIIRHLQLHAKDETVPEIGPVNPVPCLDKKERMFDKMVNLASSSHQNGRMGGKPKEPVKESDEDTIPKFVPEHKRYVCGVAECNYLTVDEAMLRYHLKALHSEEPYFRCPHCPQPSSGQESQNIAIDKMGVHLKMHDTRLYKCSHCNHHHYHRHVVERHLTDKHPEKRPFVKVVRELDSTENVQQPVQEEAEEEAPDPDGNHWKCNLCDFKCAYKAEMASHAATVHDEKTQYKCTLCSFKTSGKILFEQHISSKHAYDPNVDFILVYQRIKGVNKRNTETVEQTGQDEPFDTTPLWRRDMPRVRHIRGILLEEEDELSTTETLPTKVSLGKRKSETEIATKAKLKAGKSASFDENKQTKDKSKRSLSCEKLSEEMENDSQSIKESSSKSDLRSITNKLAEDSKEVTELNDVNDSDVGRFGPYGKPDGNMYVCTLCIQYKTKYKHDMRDHLYRELDYARWHCKACGYLSVNRSSLAQHITKHHNGEPPNHEPLSPDNAIEDWVTTLLRKQTDMIKTFQQVNTTCKNVTTSVNKLSSSPEVINAITTKTIRQNDKKTVDLAPAITTLQNDILRDANRSIDTDDGDSRDNEDLVIDMKEDEILEDGNNENVPENDKSFEKDEPEKTMICKHCEMKFTRWRGFKLHVQLTHLKRLGFLCPYCDRSTNSESLMRQHMRSKHPGCQVQIVHNPAAGGPELTNEFWEKEYGLICPKRSRKHKRKSNVDLDSSGGGGDNEASIRANTQEKCEICGFMAINYTGLKSHMRLHIPKHSIKCPYCTFSCSIKHELQEHWEVNHPSMPFKIQNIASTGSPPPKKRNIDIYKDDIEEEHVVSIDDVTSTTKTMAIYSCFYCNLRSYSLVTIKRHWSYMHKQSKDIENAMAASLPFKYREQHLPVPKDPVQCRGWICQWCDEFCETDNDMKAHQDMYHSHLPFNFKMQKQQQQNEEDQPKGYVCSVCSYATISVASIRRHVVRHIDLFKCKYCDQTFSTPLGVSAHSIEKHPGLATKIESISNFDSVVESLINTVRRNDVVASSSGIVTVKSESDQSRVLGVNAPRASHAVARKSTTKSAVSYARPGPRVFKAVARKSTNPLPRHLRGGVNYDVNQRYAVKTELDEGIESEPASSHYRIPRAPINLAKLNTYMVVGGHSMRVNCTTLAQLIDIDPHVILEDIKLDSKYATILSKYN